MTTYSFTAVNTDVDQTVGKFNVPTLRQAFEYCDKYYNEYEKCYITPDHLLTYCRLDDGTWEEMSLDDYFQEELKAHFS